MPRTRGPRARRLGAHADRHSGALARSEAEPIAQLKRLAARLGEPVVRTAVRQAMRILASQFVIGETIEEAVTRSRAFEAYRFSYDMLGEAARSAEDAARYFDAYARAIRGTPAGDGVSVKLSALHPRFEEAKRARVFDELAPRVAELVRLAEQCAVGITIDAEESERLELTLDLFEALSRGHPLGLAVQAYQKRALAVCDWLVGLRRRVSVRLVKGAYWDGEIKRAQQLGMPDYPVFTRKLATDLSYVACARRLLSAPATLYPAFATHNCRTVATIFELAGDRPFEFQKLFGMGDTLYEVLSRTRAFACRIYAPVGSFTDLLPYLVRRLLENGANTSFVHQIADPAVPLEALVADPLEALPEPYSPDPRIPLPRNLYPDRLNSLGVDLARRDVLDSLEEKIGADRGRESLGAVESTTARELDFSIARAAAAFDSWTRVPAAERAAALERAADAMERRMQELVSLIVREGGRTYADAVSEVRERPTSAAITPCRRRSTSRTRPRSRPRGRKERTFSPRSWSVRVHRAVELPARDLHRPGRRGARRGKHGDREARRADAAHRLPRGRDPAPGRHPCRRAVLRGGRRRDRRRAARCRSTDRGRRLHRLGRDRAPHQRRARRPPGTDCDADRGNRRRQRHGGRRLRAPRAGRGRRGRLGVPERRAALLGAADPVRGRGLRRTRDAPARRSARRAQGRRSRRARHRRRTDHRRRGARGASAARREAARGRTADRRGADPGVGQLSGSDRLRDAARGAAENRGLRPGSPCLSYRRDNLGRVLQWIRDTGYGLTLGVHSRIQSFVDAVVTQARVGNVYVNRSMIGAVVGVQPFGGEGLSGTGPKAGGPHYLFRFATERTLTVNTAAVGGVTELLTRPSI
jgi:RHH-type proline utilization regulon transcriptional repressor/proline dehydrogenase/delta 1-pyrroline-5-carboxylate dehydrogenase